MAKSPQGKELPFSSYRGKTLLVVNTATKCGFAPQFRDLEALHQKYKDKGLVVLGFPSDQFLGQEPESNPVFKYLKENLPGTFGKRIKWNFTKFLVSSRGMPYKRYAPRVRPQAMEEDIRRLLG